MKWLLLIYIIGTGAYNPLPLSYFESNEECERSLDQWTKDVHFHRGRCIQVREVIVPYKEK